MADLDCNNQKLEYTEVRLSTVTDQLETKLVRSWLAS